MPKVQITSQIEIDFDDMLKGVAQLGNSELDQFVEEVVALRAQRRAPSLPNNEAELIEKISRGVPTKMRTRLAKLQTKLFEETLTSEEQSELIGITDRIEQTDAERLHDLILLAELRNVSIDALMEQLGIRQSLDA
jgi:hypothetical protein